MVVVTSDYCRHGASDMKTRVSTENYKELFILFDKIMRFAVFITSTADIVNDRIAL